MAARRWIRLDAEWDESGWIIPLHGLAQLAWIRLLCHVKLRGSLGRSKALQPDVAAKLWRLPERHVVAMLETATAHGALVVDGGEWVLTKWAEYQEVDRTAADRMRKMRDSRTVSAADKPTSSVLRGVTRNERNVTRNSTVTRHATETETLKKDPSGPKKARHKNPEVELPDGWTPNAQHRAMALERGVDLEHEVEQFRDHAEANDRRLRSWDAGFRTWLRNARPTQPHRNGAADPARRSTVKPPSRRLAGAEPDPLWR